MRRLQGSITSSLLGSHAFFPPILAHFTLCINQIVLEHLNNNDSITIHTLIAYLIQGAQSPAQTLVRLQNNLGLMLQFVCFIFSKNCVYTWTDGWKDMEK